VCVRAFKLIDYFVVWDLFHYMKCLHFFRHSVYIFKMRILNYCNFLEGKVEVVWHFVLVCVSHRLIRSSVMFFVSLAWKASLHVSSADINLVSRVSSDSTVSGYGLDSRAIEVRSPTEAKGFFL
jgi:hypothetical protein